LSRALIVQSSTDKQYSGDSYFREQDFIQTNPHCTLPRILIPVSATLASQEFTQAFPKPHSQCNSSQPMGGWSSQAPGNSSRPLSVQVQSRGSPATPSGRWEEHTLKQQLPLRQSLGKDPDSAQSLAFRERAMSGSEAWVFMLCDDLIVGVIGLTTLGLAYLHITCHSQAWFLSPNTHWLIILISTIFPTLTKHNPSRQQQSYICSPQPTPKSLRS
jgi:hypothetical protein